MANQTLASVKGELDAHPEYNLVAVGHSLGGALASIAGVSLQQNFPKQCVDLSLL